MFIENNKTNSNLLQKLINNKNYELFNNILKYNNKKQKIDNQLLRSP